MEVALHTRLTLVVVDMHPVRVWKMMPEVLTVSWAEFQGTPMAVRLAWAPVVEVGTGEEYQGRRQGRAAGNTGAPKEGAEVLRSAEAVGYHQCFRVASGLQEVAELCELAPVGRQPAVHPLFRFKWVKTRVD